MKRILCTILAAVAMCANGAALANHDPRDPEGLCVALARAAYSWAVTNVENPITVDQAREGLTPSPDDIASVPEARRALLVRSINKGIQLVWESKPALTPEEVGNQFYEWCIGQVAVKAEGL